jgi:hypothetical protein
MPWSNYNMAAFRFERLNLKDPGVLFNPYIEGSSKSNCIYCHARALYRYPPAKGYAAVDAKAGGAKQDPTVVPCRPDSPSDKAAADVRFNCDPEHMTPTHFLWSLATWLDPGVPKD